MACAPAVITSRRSGTGVKRSITCSLSTRDRGIHSSSSTWTSPPSMGIRFSPRSSASVLGRTAWCYHGPWRRERATARARGRGARLPRQADQPARGAREDPPVGGGGQMTGRHFLAVVAVAQGALLVALIILIILNRWFRLRRRARVHPRVVRLNSAMQRWALGSTDL